MAEYTGSCPLRALTDAALLARLEALVAQQRESTADIVEHLMEVDRREVAIDLAYPSLFVYCLKKLGYSEAAAFSRIRAARAAASFPDVLTRLRAGSLHLDSIARLYPYLDRDNSRELLNRASGASKREVLSIVAKLQTEPGAQRDMIVPVRASAQDSPLQPPPPPCDPTSGQTEPILRDPHPAEQTLAAAEIIPPPRHRFHFTADAELLELVGKLRGLLRHKIPDGRLERIFKVAAQALLAHLEHDKSVLADQAERSPSVPDARPDPKDGSRGSRIVPRAVKRAVWTRDGGRCAYTAPDGGRSDTPGNIRLLCRAHNQRLGRRRFGPRRGS